MTDKSSAEPKIEKDTEAKKNRFTAESGLGFMRVIQVVNILMIVLSLVSLLFVCGSRMPIDFMLISIVVDLVSQSVIVWLIAKRKQYTRQIAMVLYAVSALNYLIMNFATDNLTTQNVVYSVLPVVLFCLYFSTSRRAKAVLVQPFDILVKDRDLAAQTKMWNPKSLDFWLRLLIYFFVFSVLGHWMEMGVQLLVINGLFPGTIAGPDSLTWRDSLNPFFIYGIAVAICGLVLFPIYVKLKEVVPQLWIAFAISFFINMAFCVVAELILGFAFNADHSAWDYSNQPFNFQGQICLLYSIAFGVFSSVITWLIYPFMERQFSYIGKDVFRIIFVASAVTFAMLYVLYNVDLARLGVLTQDEQTTFTEAFRDSTEGDSEAATELTEEFVEEEKESKSESAANASSNSSGNTTSNAAASNSSANKASNAA